MASLDSILSDYRDDSELSRATVAGVERPLRVGGDLLAVLRAGQALAEETGGALDVTAGRVVRLWRAARHDGRLPDGDAICDALSRSGWRLMTIDTLQRTVQFGVAGMRLDAGAIGKGYAADEALAVIRSHGLDRALVSLGGDMVVGAPPTGERGWTVAIDLDSAGRALVLDNGAVSTSGDAEQFVDIGGVRYSHVVNPLTGVGLTTGVSVTVVAPTGLEADAWATAASVLDSARRATFIAARPGAMFYVRGPASAGNNSRTNSSTACRRGSDSVNVTRTFTRMRGR
jgi:thiamine biosynthesis lipoprotein